MPHTVLADQIITLQATIMACANDFMLLTAVCVLAISFVFAIGATASLRGGRVRCASRRMWWRRGRRWVFGPDAARGWRFITPLPLDSL